MPQPTVYIIIEEIQHFQNGECSTEKAVVQTFGYFTEYPEELINRLNDEHNANLDEDDKEPERFQGIPLAADSSG